MSGDRGERERRRAVRDSVVGAADRGGAAGVIGRSGRLDVHYRLKIFYQLN